MNSARVTDPFNVEAIVDGLSLSTTHKKKILYECGGTEEGFKQWIEDHTVQGGVRRSDPDTSYAAAQSLTSWIETRVLEALATAGPNGLTSHETATILDLPLVSVSPRFAPLRRKGLVRAGPVKRQGVSGRMSTVWVSTNVV